MIIKLFVTQAVRNVQGAFESKSLPTGGHGHEIWKYYHSTSNANVLQNLIMGTAIPW